MKRIAILGSTGSIGKSTLQIVEAFADRFSVTSLAAGGNVDLAFEQARRWHPKIVSMASAESADHLQDKLRKVGLKNSIEVTDHRTLSDRASRRYTLRGDSVVLVA